VRDAINRETMGYWRRNGKKVLRGEETLGRFSANRSLVVRDRGVKLERREVTQEGKTFQKFFLSLRLEPVPAETTEVAVFMPAKDKFKRDLLDALAADPDRIRKATICFKRPGRKVYLLLTYAKPLVQIEREGPTMLVSVLSDGSCWLRCEGRSLSLANRIYRLIHMKEHFARIHARLRAHLGKRGSRYRAKMALLKAGNFTTWALIPLHQLSREILAYAEQQQAKEIHWQIDAGAPDLPWYQLQSMVQYKAQEVGIVAEVTRMKDRVAVEKEEAA
jgi:hypothetical protein